LKFKMELLGTKIISMVLLGGVSLLIGMITFKMSSMLGLTTGCRSGGRKQRIATSLLLCFGAGVLLATSLLHILPEAREGLEEEAESLEIHWLAELCFSAGFFLIYLIEEIVHVVLDYTSHTEQVHRTFSTRKSGADHSDGTDERCCENTDQCHSDMELGSVDESNNTKYNPKYEVRLSVSTNSMFPNYHSPETTDVKSPVVAKKVEKPAKNQHSHTFEQSDSIMRDMITVLALSFHAVFEGLAVGLEENVSDVWMLFGAIAAHKFVITFTVCLELLASRTKTLFYFVYLSTFALVTPLGIGIGLLISEMSVEEDSNSYATAILQGLAGGTIIYVVMFEVLQREKMKEVSGLLQLVAIIVGFSVMLVIEILGKHHHHHHHDHDHDHDHAKLDPILNHTSFVPLEV